MRPTRLVARPRWPAWLAALGLTLQGLLPLAYAFAGTTDGRVAVCTATGVIWVDSAGGTPDPTQASHAAHECCCPHQPPPVAGPPPTRQATAVVDAYAGYGGAASAPRGATFSAVPPPARAPPQSPALPV